MGGGGGMAKYEQKFRHKTLLQKTLRVWSVAMGPGPPMVQRTRYDRSDTATGYFARVRRRRPPPFRRGLAAGDEDESPQRPKVAPRRRMRSWPPTPRRRRPAGNCNARWTRS